MQRTVREEQSRYNSFVHVDPIGFTHNMRPSSIQELIDHIGLDRIRRARVLEVGCGQGFLVSHLLNAGASHVTGTEVEQDIVTTIPLPAYQLYRNQGQTVAFRVEDFLQTPMNIQVDMITMFIGTNILVHRLLDIFVQNPHVETIAFMKPARDRAIFQEHIDELLQTNGFSIATFRIHLSISGEQRQAVVMKKIHPPTVVVNPERKNTKKQYKRLGFTKRGISRVYSSKKHKKKK
jgi:hypothetical protein